SPRYQRGTLRGSRALVIPGAPAAAISLGLGGFSRIEEHHVLALGQPCRRARPAVHARRTHGVNKVTIRGAVACLHGSPAVVVGFVGKGRMHDGSSAFIDYGVTIRTVKTASTPILAINVPPTSPPATIDARETTQAPSGKGF